MSISATSIHLLNTFRGGDSTTSLGSLFQCLATSSVKKFFLIPSLNLPWHNLRPFPWVLSLVPEKRDQHLSHCNFLSGSCRHQWGLPSASSFRAPVPSATSHKSCFLVPSPASLLFPAHTWATQWPSCSEGPQTAHNIQVEHNIPPSSLNRAIARTLFSNIYA